MFHVYFQNKLFVISGENGSLLMCYDDKLEDIDIKKQLYGRNFVV